ncbi:hypothetical protein J2Y69_002621 [Microbacterium resistens]|uniref:DNA/RNA endonuclease G n=1 Tax=Microbacterium resistens TaxID=156977 RepID=A0ABU1SGC4_9MICO|nr:hypothetical protein [Microbacterium resistens]MDR6868013.1 hypothetical protein [Microbacterium resistens]
MTSEQRTYRRLLRRETHSPRTVAAVVVASVLLLGIAAGGALAIWAGVDDAGRRFAAGLGEGLGAAMAGHADPAGLVVVTAVMALAGILLITLAVTPGRRARRSRTAERSAVLVDDGVLADAAASAVAVRCGIPRGQVAVTVGPRRATVRIRPVSGVAVDREGAASAATATLSDLGFTTRSTVIVSPNGVLS